MYVYWGWVTVGENGECDVGDYLKLNSNESGNTVTGHEVPDEVLEIMALTDLLPDYTKLKGGSWKGGRDEKGNQWYYIGVEDLKPQAESDI